MITVADALDLIDRNCPAPVFEHAPLAAAAGRVLGETLTATEDLPPFARSAMDGYLVRLGEQSRTLRVVGELRAGDDASMPTLGCAIRISTGCAVPDANAAVIPKEDVEAGAGVITISRTPDQRYIRPRGSQARAGTCLLEAGTPLTAGAVGLLASIGACMPRVACLVPTTHLATGREIVPATGTPAGGQIRDSNSPMIAALVNAAHGSLLSHALLPDDPDTLTDAVRAALGAGARLLLISGGASVGDHDHTRPVLRATGFDIIFSGVAVKPGKPVAFARRGDVIAFALPGNPLSHFVCFHLFVRRALARMCGLEPAATVPVPAPPDLARLRGDREIWWPCTSGAGALKLASWQDSSDLLPLASANALVRIPGLADGPDPDTLEVLMV